MMPASPISSLGRVELSMGMGVEAWIIVIRALAAAAVVGEPVEVVLGGGEYVEGIVTGGGVTWLAERGGEIRPLAGGTGTPGVGYPGLDGGLL